MRIERPPPNTLPSAFLWLTAGEASELRDALNDLLATDQVDWHAHVSSADYETELNIARDG
jgi:hypothetical protein